MLKNLFNVMSDTSNDSNGRDKGIHIDKKGFHCIPCRFKRQFYHKETKTVKENNTVTTDTVVDKRNIKFGGNGRHTSPDDIFKDENSLQAGSVEICDTGWGKSQITPEELEERLDKCETDIIEIKRDIEDIAKNELHKLD